MGLPHEKKTKKKQKEKEKRIMQKIKRYEFMQQLVRLQQEKGMSDMELYL